MCVCVYACVCSCLYVRLCVYGYAFLLICVCAYVRVRMCVYGYVRVCVDVDRDHNPKSHAHAVHALHACTIERERSVCVCGGGDITI